MGLDQYFYKLRKLENDDKERIKTAFKNSKNEDEFKDAIWNDFYGIGKKDHKKDTFKGCISDEQLNDYTFEIDKYFIYDKEEIAYFRKSNQLRNWIVQNTDYSEDDDCVNLAITRDCLRTLLNDIDNVLSNHSKAEELLPTKSGFFFGSTEYDEYYFDDLRYIREQLESIINTTTDDDIILYYEWW